MEHEHEVKCIQPYLRFELSSIIPFILILTIMLNEPWIKKQLQLLIIKILFLLKEEIGHLRNEFKCYFLDINTAAI